MSEMPEKAVNEMRVIAKQVASMYMSTEAARLDCADILYEALEVVWRSQQAEIETLRAVAAQLYSLVPHGDKHWLTVGTSPVFAEAAAWAAERETND